MEENMKTNYIIYTDGGCIPNPGGKGGIGIVILQENKIVKKISEGYYPTTNNRMEVRAAIRALEEIEENQNVIIISDSQYLVRTMWGEYGMGKNTDLWNRLTKLVKRQKSVEFQWVKGHNGNQWNETCDDLATEAINSPTYIEDTGYTGTKAKQNTSQEFSLPENLQSKIRPIPEDRISEKELRAIQTFLRIQAPKFKDYANLKTFGQDYFSRMNEEKMVTEINDTEIVQYLQENIPDEEMRKKIMRWYLRGISLRDSIRKVEVDKEITDNAIKARYGR